VKTKSTSKKYLALVWLLLFLVVIWKLVALQIPIPEYPQRISDFVKNFGVWAPIIFILLFAVRPFIFFPATILSLSAGLLFGTSQAILLLLIAENLSAFVSYSIGKYFGAGIIAKFDTENKIMSKFEKYFHTNDFITILSLRLIFAPFDLVGYVAGASKISYRSFALATFLGIIPGLLMSAFLGGSIANPYYLGVAVILFVLTLVVSKLIKKRNES
jgi:uncharacterized membrane protein YdjX (TVP38/TMEM64 family)